MLTRDMLHPYQNRAISFIKEKKKVGLFLDLGLGKTTSTLTTIQDLKSEGKIKRSLIIAPLRVANSVWKQESEKWEHLLDLDFAIVTGGEENRLRALKTKADVYVINRENVKWLIDLCVKKRAFPFDFVAVDESSSFKSHKAQRFKSLCRSIDKIKYMVLLTGTPAPNNIMDLWSQIYLLDKGDRLGKNITEFKNRYFMQTGYGGYAYQMISGSDQKVRDKIKDVCLSMEAKDYLDMPQRIDIAVNCDMPVDAEQKYLEMQENFYLELSDDKEIVASHAAVIAGKLLQFCNGAVYDDEKEYHVLHDEKIEALKDIIDDNSNENILVAYNYKSDLERLKKAFPYAVTLDRKGACVPKWNNGEIKIMLAHPASAGHGLNLQKGGSLIVWFGLNWSLELYQQFNGRLYRQGQEKPVRIIHIISKISKGYSLDEAVMSAIDRKAKNQDQLIQFLKEKIGCKNGTEEETVEILPGTNL